MNLSRRHLTTLNPHDAPTMRRMALFALALLYACLSCSKGGDPNANPDHGCDRIVEVMSYSPYGPDLYENQVLLTYDDANRVKTAKISGGGQTDYAYFDDRIEMTLDYFGDVSKTTYFLDKDKRIRRSNALEENFTYDGDGYLTSFRSGYGVDGQIYGYIRYTLEYARGNLVRVYTDDKTVSWQGTEFTYYDQPAIKSSGYFDPLKAAGVASPHFDSYLIEAGYFGRRSKNLMRSAYDIDYAYAKADINYLKDTRGRIIEVPERYRFKYQCD